MIDSHCHIDLYPDPKQVVAECLRRHLTIISVTTTPSAWRVTSSLALDHETIFTALGLHPALAEQRRAELPLFDALLPSVAFVGEVGLDGTPETLPFSRHQLDVFRHILRSCETAGGRILSIHSRRAATQVLDELHSHVHAGKFILHWFSGSQADLKRAIRLDCWFSVGSPMLQSAKGRLIVSRIPHDRLLTETDGPFVQIEGHAILPWHVERTTKELAEVWKLDLDQTLKQLEINFKTLLTHVKI